MNTSELRPQLDSLQRTALIMGVVGLVLCIAGALLPGSREAFFHSYLFSYLFWLGVTVGSLGLLLLHGVVGGGWGFIIRRFLEAGTRLLPLAALLFVPLIIGLQKLYPWANDQIAARDSIIQVKSAYLNVPFFIGRIVFYFVVWMALAYFLNKWSAQQDEKDDPKLYERITHLSAPGIILYVLIMTFAMVDLVMSLTPHWFSSIIGLLFVAAFGLQTMAMMLALTARLGTGTEPLSQVPHRYFRDLGNFMLAMVLLWAYTSFSQFLIIYSGNLAEEVTWYVPRMQNGWQFIGLALIVGHFALPFLVLLIGSNVKRSPERLAKVAFFILCMRLVDLFWWVVPNFRERLSVTPWDLGLPLLIGAVWLSAWIWQLRDKPLVPVHDPRLEGSWPLGQGHGHGHGHGEVIEHG